MLTFSDFAEYGNCILQTRLWSSKIKNRFWENPKGVGKYVEQILYFKIKMHYFFPELEFNFTSEVKKNNFIPWFTSHEIYFFTLLDEIVLIHGIFWHKTFKFHFNNLIQV